MAINTPYAIAFDQHTISSTALGLVDLDFTQAQIDETNRIIISVRSGSVNLRYDGTVPTVAIGHTLFTGDIYPLAGDTNIQLLELIRNGGTDAVVDITLESN